MVQQAGGNVAASMPVDRGFHPLRVSSVVPETSDTVSLVFEIPGPLRDTFDYEAGQFCTFRIPVGGTDLLRCYSMSSAPEVDPELTVTVKRVPGGAVSNWINDNVAAGDEIEATRPAGVFRLVDATEDLVAFAAGSGITPVLSLVKSALASTGSRIRMLYANRDRESIIFREVLGSLVAEYPERLEVVHHLDIEQGFPDDASVREFVGAGIPVGAQVFICGPTPFMDVTEGAMLDLGVDSSRIHVERFTPAAEPDPPAIDSAGTTDGAASAESAVVTVELDGRIESVEHRPGTTVLQVARQVGLSPPYSCESGSCATCMARLVDGTVEMHVNDVLTVDEVDEGWVLTCQSVPTSPTVHVVYGFD